jgi:hypothetical protein
MTDAHRPFRLAIGLFHEPQSLQRAITDLARAGVSDEQLSLVGARTAVERLRRSGAGPLQQLKPLPQLAGKLELVASDGGLLDTLLEHTASDASDTVPAQGWLLPDLFAGLAEHLAAGAVALLVGAPDIGTQRRSSRILLRHSAHTVQTHEFVLRRS